ncbi:MAG: radical SAM protein [Spirochaetota bacterium]
MKPVYLDTAARGVLVARAAELYAMMKHCTLCPHGCGVDRTAGERGFCRSGILPVVSSAAPHFGEENVLVGKNGSGTVFFTHCNMACIFCQNYDISHLGSGREITYDDLAGIMIRLQNAGCHNINLVTPTHMVYAIIRSLDIAVERGLSIPLVYNTGGYDTVPLLHLLDGIVDIYMPDYKYADSSTAQGLSGVSGYPDVARNAIAEMHRQTGDLSVEGSLAVRGLLVRHLVLPGNAAGTFRVMDDIAALSTDTYINIMDQYRPEYRAHEDGRIRRRTTLDEYDEILAYARRKGLHRGPQLDGHRGYF